MICLLCVILSLVWFSSKFSSLPAIGRIPGNREFLKVNPIVVRQNGAQHKMHINMQSEI